MSSQLEDPADLSLDKTVWVDRRVAQGNNKY